MRYALGIFGKAAAGAVVLLLVAFALFIGLVWRGSRIPPRPANISSNGVFLERGSVPFKFSTHGDWVDCWRDVSTTVARCRLADEHGTVKFEDDFVPYDVGTTTLPNNLLIDAERTGSLRTDPPLVFLSSGRVLLPKGQLSKAKQLAAEWVGPAR